MLMDREARNKYVREYKRRKRLERGLQKCGRKPYSEDEKALAKLQRQQWESKWVKMYKKNHPAKRMLWSARRRAKEKNLPINIEEGDIIVPTHCPYLGIELSFHVPRGGKRDTIASLDRIKPELGYIKGNIEVISHLANTMKSDAPPQLLINFAEEIIKRYKQ